MPFFRKRITPSPAPVTPVRPAPPGPGIVLRKSTALKDFLLKIPELDRRSLLDLGRACQATISFFADRGFRITVQPLLESWRQFLEEQQIPGPQEAMAPSDPAVRAQEFLNRELQFPPASFHSVLAWDVFDCFEPPLTDLLVKRLHELLAPGGVLLALFHSEPPAQRWSYRVRDLETIELVPDPRSLPVVNVLNNRQILNLFARFRSCTTYIARDQLREVLVVRE
jgi:hypothetical protein